MKILNIYINYIMENKINDENIDKNEKLLNLMQKDFFYPDIDDENFQSKIYIKKEYNKRKIKKRKLLTDYIDIKKYRDDQCSGNFKLRPQQYLLSNYIINKNMILYN